MYQCPASIEGQGPADSCRPLYSPLHLLPYSRFSAHAKLSSFCRVAAPRTCMAGTYGAGPGDEIQPLDLVHLSTTSNQRTPLSHQQVPQTGIAQRLRPLKVPGPGSPWREASAGDTAEHGPALVLYESRMSPLWPPLDHRMI